MLTEPMEANWPVRFVTRARGADADRSEGIEDRFARAPPRAVEARKHIFTEGDLRSHLYCVESGAICIYKMLPDGRRQVVGFAYPGDLLGFGPPGPHQLNAQATKGSQLRCLPWPSVERAAQRDPALGIALWEAIAQELAAAHELLLTTGQRTAMERVAAFLLAISRRNASQGEYR